MMENAYSPILCRLYACIPVQILGEYDDGVVSSLRYLYRVKCICKAKLWGAP